mmetsp:Transcript_15640/g.47659  ORF Transcript_15640/g.47659 Transcript_15640/m.47659 type:complete len:241 (+) Transcript_15640:2046-2768(+)
MLGARAVRAEVRGDDASELLGEALEAVAQQARWKAKAARRGHERQDGGVAEDLTRGGRRVVRHGVEESVDGRQLLVVLRFRVGHLSHDARELPQAALQLSHESRVGTVVAALPIGFGLHGAGRHGLAVAAAAVVAVVQGPGRPVREGLAELGLRLLQALQRSWVSWILKDLRGQDGVDEGVGLLAGHRGDRRHLRQLFGKHNLFCRRLCGRLWRRWHLRLAEQRRGALGHAPRSARGQAP